MRDKFDHKELQRRLKEDEIAVFFQEFSTNIKAIYEQYGRSIGMGILVVALVVCASYLWRAKTTADFNDSQVLFSSAAANIEKENYSEAVVNLDNVIQNYSGSHLVPAATVLRGDCYFHLEQYDMAEKDYRSAIPNLPAADAIPVRIALVQTYRSQDKFDEALAELDALEKDVKTHIAKDQIVYLKAGCYEDKNDIAQALELYKSIPSTSDFYRVARERIDWLEAKPVEAINT